MSSQKICALRLIYGIICLAVLNSAFRLDGEPLKEQDNNNLLQIRDGVQVEFAPPAIPTDKDRNVPLETRAKKVTFADLDEEIDSLLADTSFRSTSFDYGDGSQAAILRNPTPGVPDDVPGPPAVPYFDMKVSESWRGTRLEVDFWPIYAYVLSPQGVRQNISIRGRRAFVNNHLVCQDVTKLGKSTYQRGQKGAMWFTNLPVGPAMTDAEIMKFKAKQEKIEAARFWIAKMVRDAAEKTLDTAVELTQKTGEGIKNGAAALDEGIVKTAIAAKELSILMAKETAKGVGQAALGTGQGIWRGFLAIDEGLGKTAAAAAKQFKIKDMKESMKKMGMMGTIKNKKKKSDESSSSDG